MDTGLPPVKRRRRRSRAADANALGNAMGEGPPTKRPRTKNKSTSLMVPTEATLDHGTTSGGGGGLALPERLDGAAVMPPPELQNIQTLTAPSQRALLDAGADTMAWHTLPPEVALRLVYARQLLEPSASGINKKNVRVTGASVGQVVPARIMGVVAMQEAKADAAAEHSAGLLRYYAPDLGDAEPDPDLPFGQDVPAAYPALRAFLADVEPLYRTRADAMAEAALALPRVPVERVSREYCEPFLHPFDMSTTDPWPPCELGRDCICCTLARAEGNESRGFVAPRFFRPSELRAWRDARAEDEEEGEDSIPPGKCLLDLLLAWSTHANVTLKHRHMPSEPVNTVDFSIGAGEFAREAMIPTEVEGLPVGMAGHVLEFRADHLQYYEWQPPPPGGTAVPERGFRGKHWALQWVHVDFRPSLSETNACLGGRKLRPLAGPRHLAHIQVSRADLLAPVGLVLSPSTANGGEEGEEDSLAVAWLRFIKGAPAVVVADRALAGRQSEHENVPAVWLRRYFITRYDVQDHTYWRLTADATLCAFEDTVNLLLADQSCRTAALLLVAMAEQRWPDYYAGLPPQFHCTARRRPGDMVWLAVHWRLAASVALQQDHARPLQHTEEAGRLAYFSRLFRDTHLDLLLAMADAQDDTQVWLAAYPHALRCECADEMPDLATMHWVTNRFYDSSQKSMVAFVQQLKHIMGKLDNQGCQSRGVDAIVSETMAQYPTIGALVQCMWRIVMLGNTRTSQRPVWPLWVRLRLHQSARHAATMCEWVAQYPKLLITVLRDYCLYVTEVGNTTFDRLQGTSVRWTRFKAMARHVAGDVRDALTAHVLLGAGSAMWAQLETMCAQWHEQTKPHNIKFLKGQDLDILLQKLTYIEKKLDWDNQYTALYEWMRADGRLEATRIAAWSAARTMRQPMFTSVGARRTMPTAMLKPLGMSAGSYHLLREWLYDYNEYNIKDNGVGERLRAMFAHDPRDIILLKTYLRYVEHYLDDVFYCASSEQTREQWRALRTDLALEPWTATPPRLGMAYLCEGCGTWASPVVVASRALLAMDPLRAPGKSRAIKKKARRHNTASMSIVMEDDRAGKPVLPPGESRGSTGRVDFAKYHPIEAALYCNRAKFRPVAPTVDIQKDIVRPLLAHDLTCERPLLGITMVGVFRRVGRLLYTRCVYCGMLCQAHAVNTTNAGQSCGRHMVPCGVEYPRDHRLWRHLGIPVVKETRGESDPILPQESCSACSEPSRIRLVVFDECYRLHVLALCRWHLYCLRTLLPAAEATDTNHPPPPLRLYHVAMLLRNK